jgi:hypothetical protein
MGKRITLSIEASGAETAPTVDDLVAQLGDYYDLLGIVERTIAVDGTQAVQWRIVHASRVNPLSLTLEAFARQFAVNVDERVELVVDHTNQGLRRLRDAPERPPYFNDEAVRKAEGIFERVTNGLALTRIEVAGEDAPALALQPSVARVAAKNALTVLAPVERPYKEIGSVEGYFESVSLDGYGRRILHIKHRLTGDEVKCIVAGDAARELALREIGDVWRKRRISVFGTIHFKAPGRISQVEASAVRFLRSRNELPDIDDIIDPDFTGGVKSEEYLAKLRDGENS